MQCIIHVQYSLHHPHSIYSLLSSCSLLCQLRRISGAPFEACWEAVLSCWGPSWPSFPHAGIYQPNNWEQPLSHWSEHPIEAHRFYQQTSKQRFDQHQSWKKERKERERERERERWMHVYSNECTKPLTQCISTSLYRTLSFTHVYLFLTTCTCMCDNMCVHVH